MGGEELCGQLPGQEHALALGQGAEQTVEVARLDYLQILVGSRVLRASYAQGRVEKGHSFFLQKLLQLIKFEGFMVLVDEMKLVIKEHVAEDTPHVVLKVGVIPLHTPAFGRGRKGAEHEQSCVGGQPRFERMGLDHFCSFTKYTTTGR